VIMSTYLDGVILLTRYDSTRSSEARRALEHLRAVKANLLGTILNRVRTRKYFYGYHSGYGYGKYGKYGYGKKTDKKS